MIQRALETKQGQGDPDQYEAACLGGREFLVEDQRAEQELHRGSDVLEHAHLRQGNTLRGGGEQKQRKRGHQSR